MIPFISKLSIGIKFNCNVINQVMLPTKTAIIKYNTSWPKYCEFLISILEQKTLVSHGISISIILEMDEMRIP